MLDAEWFDSTRGLEQNSGLVNPPNAVRDLGGPRRLLATGAHGDRQAIPSHWTHSGLATGHFREVTMTGENAAPIEGWALPPRPHCGEWHETVECPTCNETLTLPDCELGEN